MLTSPYLAGPIQTRLASLSETRVGTEQKTATVAACELNAVSLEEVTKAAVFTKAGPTNQAQTVTEQWKTGYRARVDDAGLTNALQALFTHHHDLGFFSKRFEGMALEKDAGPDALEFQFVPNRKYARATGGLEEAGCSCPFCSLSDPNDAGGKVLNWRGYRILPNAFPYAPRASQHTVIAAEGHVEQSFSAALLEDMIDFSGRAGHPVTMHYNGIAGNSQQHLHWHATAEVMPLQTKLDQGTLPVTLLRASHEGRLSTYQQGFYSGFLLEGDKAYVSRHAARIVKRLDADPISKGHYNMVLLQSPLGQARLAIIPRRAHKISVNVEGLGPMSYGALGVAGRGIIERSAMPSGSAESFRVGVQKTVVPPSELAWVRDLATAAEAQGPLSLLVH